MTRPSRSVAAAAVAAALLGAASAHAADYKIDPAHTYATFAIDHFGASVNRARLSNAKGTVQFDRAARAGKVDITVDVGSVKSGSAQFDQHLQSADIFDAAKYPTMRFVSDRMVFAGDRVSEVPGQLTLMGQTHPVTLKANQFNCYQSPILKAEVCGGDFEAVIDRTQWGINYMADKGFTKNVKITATIEAAKQ